MESDSTIDELVADLRKRLRISGLAHDDFAVRDEDVGRLLAEIGRLRAIIAELVEAGENALHVLTPARPVMDGLDRTRMYLREAIAKAKAPMSPLHGGIERAADGECR
jgi:hypothetical protein